MLNTIAYQLYWSLKSTPSHQRDQHQGFILMAAKLVRTQNEKETVMNEGTIVAISKSPHFGAMEVDPQDEWSCKLLLPRSFPRRVFFVLLLILPPSVPKGLRMLESQSMPTRDGNLA